MKASAMSLFMTATVGSLCLMIGCGGDPEDDSNNSDLDCSALEESDVNGGVTLAEGTCYTVGSRLTISDGILRLEPGVRITFGQDAGFAITNEGRLRAEGTADKPIRLRGQEEHRGYWAGLTFKDSRSNDNVLDHVIVEHAGGGQWHGGEYSRAGIFIDGGNVQLTVKNSTLQANEHSALTALARDTTLVVDNVTFTDNSLGLRIGPNLVNGIAGNLTYEANDAQYVLVEGSTPGDDYVNRTQTLHRLDVPYRVANLIYFESPLTVEPGTTIEFRQDTGFTFLEDGRLIANADGADTIQFKGAEDISGFWKGLRFQKSFSTENVLANTIVENGGSSQWHGGERSRANIFLSGGNDKAMLTIRDTIIRGSGSHGISVETEAVLADCDGVEFEGNTHDDIFGQDNAIVCVD